MFNKKRFDNFSQKMVCKNSPVIGVAYCIKIGSVTYCDTMNTSLISTTKHLSNTVFFWGLVTPTLLIINLIWRQIS